MPKCILNCILTANQGKYNYDPVSKILHWDVGRIDVSKLPNIRGTVSKRKEKKRRFRFKKYRFLHISGRDCERCKYTGNKSID